MKTIKKQMPLNVQLFVESKSDDEKSEKINEETKATEAETKSIDEKEKKELGITRR